MAKSKERIEARNLRRNGESIRSIAKKVGVSKSSVSLWCGDIVLTKEQQDRLIENDRRGGAIGRSKAWLSKKNERLHRLKEYIKKGEEMVGQIGTRDLFVIGVALYWAEGNKKNRRFVFSNSDPKMIRLMIRWLTECLEIPNCDIFCKVGINQTHWNRILIVEKYWSEITGIPLTEFRKVSLKKVNSKKTYENSEEHFGTLNIFVKRSTNLNYQILGFISAMSDY